MFSRKHRHNVSESPDAGSSNTRSLAAKSKTLLSHTKLLSRPSKNPSNDVDSSRGPLGLTLLYSPPDPLVDLIFVHGLGGNSRKTWVINSHFWPQEWLPKDSGFSRARIFSYGYESDYLKGKEDCLNLHHIGKAFLAAISTSPDITGSATRIVLVGHSMGGLVTKKAYILAKQDESQAGLSQRVSAFFFLATPHRGSDSAKMLSNLLRFAYDRAYVGDLKRNSGAIQVINDEFRHFSADVTLWSFYETQKMKMFSSLIVDPESAVLGYPGEQQVPMNCDHRSICKFEAPGDANYSLLRNALASTVSAVTEAILSPSVDTRGTMEGLRRFLSVADVIDDDYLMVSEARMPTSCQWLSTSDIYTEWRAGQSVKNKVMWIRGKPAAGKSVLAGYVIDELREAKENCSYFFFKHGDKSKSRLDRCLRSLAFQMALCYNEAYSKILQLQRDDVQLDQMNDQTLWRVLFQNGLLSSTMGHHYWIIDGVDECSSTSALLNFILTKAGDSGPLRVLITSRDTPELDQALSRFGAQKIQSLWLSVMDTRSDINLVVQNRMQDLVVVDSQDRARLADTIVDKSCGSFLWTILVLEELSHCHTRSEISQILKDVPKSMESLYKRTLGSMAELGRGKRLAKAILTWVTCATRPLAVSELSGALALDIGDSFPRLEESIAALCGQLVIVDKFGKVQMIHETAREFLLNTDHGSEFCIHQTEAHNRLAQVCLLYLGGEEMKPPRTHRRQFSTDPTAQRHDFSAYACFSYSYHLSKADSRDPETMRLAQTFFKANALTWIETIAKSQNLNHLVQASRHLKTYLNACCVESSTSDAHRQSFQQWAKDLARLAITFSQALSSSPAAIYSLIPPFCPSKSMVHHTRRSAGQLSVIGALNQQWDDRLLCIDFRQSQPSTICFGDEFLAIGQQDGHITLYHSTSCQEYRVLNHGERVQLIAFKAMSNQVATCGMKHLKIWDIRRGEVVCELSSPRRPLDLAFDGEKLLVASDRNYVAVWDLAGNLPLEPVHMPWKTSVDPHTSPPRQSPCALALSTSQGILVVAYSGQPVTVWDLKEDAFIGHCGKMLSTGEMSTHAVVALALSPNPDHALLAVTYLDGDLVLLNPFTNQELKCLRACCQSLAASPNGQLLAAGGAYGVINVYEFDTLKMLYRVKSTNSFIKQLSFSKNGRLLADIRGPQCTIWEPETLLQDAPGDDSSGTTSSSMIETISLDAKTKVNCIIPHPTSDEIFCGMDNGAVILYSRKTAMPVKTIFEHTSSIRFIAYCERSGALLSIDVANRFLLHRLESSQLSTGVGDVSLVFASSLASELAATDILVGEDVGKFVLATRGSLHLFHLDSGGCERDEVCSHTLGVRKLLRHWTLSDRFLCVDDFNLRLLAWTNLRELSRVSLFIDNDTAHLKSATLFFSGNASWIVAELLNPISWTNTTSVVLYDASSIDGALARGKEIPDILGKMESDKSKNGSPLEHENSYTVEKQVALPSGVAHTFGYSQKGRLVFLDNTGWVCSADLAQSATKATSDLGISRHFFMPSDWLTGRRNVVCAIARDEIMLARGSGLVIIKGWLVQNQ